MSILGRTTALAAAYNVVGVLVQCDPSIKSIIVKINSDRNEYIIEELDDQTLVIKENMLGELKRKLDEVRRAFAEFMLITLMWRFRF